MGCRLENLVFPYEWLDTYEKLSHVGPVSYEDFTAVLNLPLQGINMSSF